MHQRRVEINSVRVHGWISSPIGFVDPTTLYFIVLYRVPSRRVDRLLTTGHRVVVDADLSDYFDQIPHADLMKSIARRVSDGRLLGWVKAWLEMAVEEDDGRGGRRRTNRARRERKGTPQGSPISPLFSNIYMRRFILGWKVLGYARHFKAEIVNYADDLAVLGRAPAAVMLASVEALMKRLKLAMNVEKTRCCRVPPISAHVRAGGASRASAVV